ncbi:MAG: SH3 domain-containing protein [Caldilineaceae bacterium]
MSYRSNGPILLVTVLAGVMLLAGCGRSGPEPTPTPTKTPTGGDRRRGRGHAGTGGTGAGRAGAGSSAAGRARAGRPGAAHRSACAHGNACAEVATITATQLNIRSGPTQNDAVVRLVDQGAQFEVLGRSDDGQWVQLGERAGCRVGCRRVRLHLRRRCTRPARRRPAVTARPPLPRPSLRAAATTCPRP